MLSSLTYISVMLVLSFSAINPPENLISIIATRTVKNTFFAMCSHRAFFFANEIEKWAGSLYALPDTPRTSTSATAFLEELGGWASSLKLAHDFSVWNMNDKMPNCYKCRYFYITHDPGKPYGCKGMRFKSKQLPARVVYLSSGEHCRLFTRKHR